MPAARVGGFVAVAAGIEMLHALRRSTAAARRQATIGAVISMAIALFLINAPFVASQALRFADRRLVRGRTRSATAIARPRPTTGRERTHCAVLAAAGNTLVAVVLVARPRVDAWAWASLSPARSGFSASRGTS